MTNKRLKFRPSIKQMLQYEFFQEDSGIKIEILDRQNAVETPDIQRINFRLRVTDQKKQNREKPAHKENEAIEFEFNLESDDCTDISDNMVGNFF